jgi:hypothetical protein
MERCVRASDDGSGGLHKIALGDELWEVVERAHVAQLPNCRFVFHRDGEPFHLRGSKSPLRKAWKRACDEAGFPDTSLHCLRRSGVRNIIRARIDPLNALKVSGLKMTAMLARYGLC